MYTEDTIAAISTALGTGGIGIVRISGDKAFDIADRIFKGRTGFKSLKSHTINYGKIVDPESGEVLDEVLVAKMNKPRTYTREDVVEINCHGGPVVVRRVLELVLRGGARLAEPGEFTKRAFLNGRIDLSQAEAVVDLINAKTDEGTRAAIGQLEGRLSAKIREARNSLIDLIAHIEVTVDYPEHDIEEITGRMVYNQIRAIRQRLADIAKDFDRGRIIREGISVVIVGRPNVGKSSLLNELAGKNRAIVTDIPGTTRDIIEEYINIKGIPVRIIDTAGIRETEDKVEKIGVERAEKAIENADLVIMMVDASCGLTEEDIRIFMRIRKKKHIIMINKIDIAETEAVDHIRDQLDDENIITTSVKNGTGLDRLEDMIEELFVEGSVGSGDGVIITNIRHKDLIDKAIFSIDQAIGSYDGGMPLDCLTIDIRDAAEYLGQITGETVSDDVIEKIFSSFCVGK